MLLQRLGHMVESGALSTYICLLLVLPHSSFVTRQGLQAQQILYADDNLRNDRQVALFFVLRVCLCARLTTSAYRRHFFNNYTIDSSSFNFSLCSLKKCSGSSILVKEMRRICPKRYGSIFFFFFKLYKYYSQINNNSTFLQHMSLLHLA